MDETLAPESLAGTSIGSYRLIERIGAGGMGVVYRAEHPGLGKRAAIKVMLPALSKNPELTARFHAEARAAARLSHPAFVTVFDFGQLPDGRAFIVMDLLEGRSLRALSRDHERLALPVALKIARQLAAGMAVAHKAGIVHRDLKPDNIFLEVNPTDPDHVLVKILDFGVAKLIQGNRDVAITQSGAMLGTPLYMSPEQCRGESTVDGRTDIYAWGCLLYAMLAGAPPFRDVDGYAGVITAHLFEAPVPLQQRAPAVPAEVAALVMRCLSKKRDERPESMTALVEALDGLADRLQLGPLSRGPHVDELGFVREPEVAPDAGDAPQATKKLAEVPMEKSPPRSGRRRGALIGAAIALVAGSVLVARATGVWRPTPAPVALDREAAGAAAPGPADAATLIRLALDLRKAGKDQDAFPLFQRAYALTPNPRAAVQLGLVEQVLRRWTDSEQHLAEGLAASNDAWIARHRDTIQKQLAVARSEIGRVEVKGDRPGAEVLIDGRSVGRLPLSQPVRVNAGTLVIELRAPGLPPTLKVISVAGGQAQSVVFNTGPADAASPAKGD